MQPSPFFSPLTLFQNKTNNNNTCPTLKEGIDNFEYERNADLLNT
jgi:hypothetical protein